MAKKYQKISQWFHSKFPSSYYPTSFSANLTKSSRLSHLDPFIPSATAPKLDQILLELMNWSASAQATGPFKLGRKREDCSEQWMKLFCLAIHHLITEWELGSKPGPQKRSVVNLVFFFDRHWLELLQNVLKYFIRLGSDHWSKIWQCVRILKKKDWASFPLVESFAFRCFQLSPSPSFTNRISNVLSIFSNF